MDSILRGSCFPFSEIGTEIGFTVVSKFAKSIIPTKLPSTCPSSIQLGVFSTDDVNIILSIYIWRIVLMMRTKGDNLKIKKSQPTQVMRVL